VPTFNSIEEESREIEKNKLDELYKSFHPDTTDIGSCYEEAHSEGASHYAIHNEMKQEFLNHQATLLFHMFEKDLKNMFRISKDTYLKGDDLKNKLEEIGISTDTNSTWYKVNKELRLISNVVKHGTGDSYDDLKKIREDLFNNNFGFLLKSDISLTLNDIEIYANYMKKFWTEFFDIVLVLEHRII